MQLKMGWQLLGTICPGSLGPVPEIFKIRCGKCEEKGVRKAGNSWWTVPLTLTIESEFISIHITCLSILLKSK